MGFSGGTGSSRQNRYGGPNTRTGHWMGPSPSQEPDFGKCKTCGKQCGSYECYYCYHQRTDKKPS